MSVFRCGGLAFAAAVVAVVGCRLEVSYDGTSYRCDDGVCPPGQTCVAGECVEETSQIAPPDASVDASPPHPDAAPVDSAPPIDAMPCEGGNASLVDPSTGACYIRFDTPKNWLVATDNCRALGGGAHLATITSAQENALLLNLAAGGVDFWLGGNDRAQEGEWRWITIESMTYVNWRAGEPNNGGNSGVVENCMIIEADMGGTWDDRPCDYAYPYLCERE